MVFVNINTKEKGESKQLAFLLGILGILLTIVVYLAPGTGEIASNTVSVEEIEFVHTLLDGIQNETPELQKMVDEYRISFSENPGILSVDFFKADTESQRQILLKEIVAKHQITAPAEIAISGGE